MSAFNLYFPEFYNDLLSYGYAPVFPKKNREDVLPIAKAFIEKVLGNGETPSFDENAEKDYLLKSVNSYYFSGTILLNDIKSPITFYINVLNEDLSVTGFSRSDRYSRTGLFPGHI